jgi:hypothetical protein
MTCADADRISEETFVESAHRDCVTYVIAKDRIKPMTDSAPVS